jgi:hypothetical protein
MIIGHLSTNKKPNLMNILFLLVVLFCLVQVIISSPVSCDSGSKKMVTLTQSLLLKLVKPTTPFALETSWMEKNKLHGSTNSSLPSVKPSNFPTKQVVQRN